MFNRLFKVLITHGLLLFSLPILAQANNGNESFLVTKEFWEKATIALVAAIFAFIGSYALAQIKRRRERRKQLSYDAEMRKGLVSIDEEIKEKVNVLYNGRKIQDLYHFVCNIENTGNTVVKDQYIRVEFLSGTEIVDKYFEPEPEREIGAGEDKASELGNNEVRYLMKHLEKGKSVGIRCIVTGNHRQEFKLHPFNELGDVEFIPRSVSAVADESVHVQAFITLFILFVIVPPVFSIIPFELGGMAAGFVRIGLVVLMVGHIKSFAKVISDVVSRLLVPRTVESNISIRELSSVERIDVKSEAKV